MTANRLSGCADDGRRHWAACPQRRAVGDLLFAAAERVEDQELSRFADFGFGNWTLMGLDVVH